MHLLEFSMKQKCFKNEDLQSLYQYFYDKISENIRGVFI